MVQISDQGNLDLQSCVTRLNSKVLGLGRCFLHRFQVLALIVVPTLHQHLLRSLSEPGDQNDDVVTLAQGLQVDPLFLHLQVQYLGFWLRGMCSDLR